MQVARSAYKRIPEFYVLTGLAITMERVNGIRLNNYIMFDFNIEKYRDITQKVLIAVKAINSVGILHRDITYENILVDMSDNVWIIDFGRAKLVCNPNLEDMLHYDMEICFDTLNDWLRGENLEHTIPAVYQ